MKKLRQVSKLPRIPLKIAVLYPIICLGFALGTGVSQVARADEIAPPVLVEVKLTPIGSFTAQFPEVIGAASVRNGEIVAEQVKIPVKKLSTGITLRDEHTQKYLEADQFPEVLLIKGVGSEGVPQTLLVKIKGIEKEISKIEIDGEKKINGSYQVIGDKVHAEFQVHPSDFNIKGINYRGAGVKDLVTVKVTLPLRTETPSPSVQDKDKAKDKGKTK